MYEITICGFTQISIQNKSKGINQRIEDGSAKIVPDNSE
jgi:hypothetical protein